MEGDPCGDVLVVTSPKEDAIVVVFPKPDGEKLADELAKKPVGLTPTVDFADILVEFEDDVDTGWAGRLSALMISAAFDWLLAMSQCLKDEHSYLLCNSVNDCLQMRGWYHRKHASIYHS